MTTRVLGCSLALTGLAVWLNWRSPRLSLFVQCGLTFFAFLVLSPAFGVQYLAWLVPWVVTLGAWPTLLLYTTTGLFLFQVYTRWAGGFPWHLAWYTGWDRPELIAAELICWASILCCTFLFIKMRLDTSR